jgi:hypothetical protein
MDQRAAHELGMHLAQPTYLASRDSSRFSDNQTREQQMTALSELTLEYGFASRGGQLGELRTAIQNGAERIPGRTSSESIQMVDTMISVTCDLIDFQAREDFKARLLRYGAVGMAMVGVTGCVLLMRHPAAIASLFATSFRP